MVSLKVLYPPNTNGWIGRVLKERKTDKWTSITCRYHNPSPVLTQHFILYLCGFTQIHGSRIMQRNLLNMRILLIIIRPIFSKWQMPNVCLRHGGGGVLAVLAPSDVTSSNVFAQPLYREMQWMY